MSEPGEGKADKEDAGAGVGAGVVTEDANAELDALNAAGEVGIFSTSKPKHAAHGLSQGVGNILKGAVGGAAMIVTAPVAGAVEGSKGGVWGGLKGFGVGLGLGVMGGAAMAVGGVATGVTQIGRGIYHTPGAIKASQEGKEWDENKKEWILYDLKVEEAEVMGMSEDEFVQQLIDKGLHKDGVDSPEKDAAAAPARHVTDKEYYEVLGVATNATTAEIKKAYYKKAKENHPDRHQDDPNANARFQKIGEAYQVLSDEQLRANYDQGGKDGVEGAPKMESGAMFAMIFGSEKFEPLVGELQLASQMQADTPVHAHPRVQAFKQRRREVQCALTLVDKLQGFMDLGCDPKAYQESLVEEAKELSSSAFGGTLLTTIGTCYYEFAKSEMNTVDSISIGFNQTTRNIATKYSIASSGIKAAMTANSVSKLQKETAGRDSVVEEGARPSTTAGAAEESRPSTSTSANRSSFDSPERQKERADKLAKKMEEMSIQMISVMWNVTQLDIQATLRKVCKKACHDHSVSEEVRLKRTQALLILGQTFVASGNTEAAGMNDMIQRLIMQMNAAQAGADGAETGGETGGETGDFATAADGWQSVSEPMPERAGEPVDPVINPQKRNSSKKASADDLD